MNPQDLESSVDPNDGEALWYRYMGEDVDPEEYAAPGWDMTRLRRDLHAKGLSGRRLADVALEIAEWLEDGGLFMTDPSNIETITLTTAHECAKYHRPVLLIGASTKAYTPSVMTPAGMTGAELVSEWAARYAAPDLVEELMNVLRTIWDRRVSWSKRTRDFFIVTIPERTSAWIRQILGETKVRRRDDGMPPKPHPVGKYGENGPDAYPIPFPGELTATVALVRAALYHGLPDICRVSYTWQHVGGDWVINLVNNHTNEVIGQVVVFAPPLVGFEWKEWKTRGFHGTITSAWGSRLMMTCDNEDDARPWVRLLTGAGLTLVRHGAGGRYLFAADDRPGVTDSASSSP